MAKSCLPNDEMQSLVDNLFQEFIEGQPVTFDLDEFTSDEITYIFAKFAAKFATYAGDGKDF